MGTVWTGDLLSVQGTKAWRGGERTNGFLMRNSDGRVAAITQAGTIDMSMNLVTPDVLPYGNGLFRLLPDATSLYGINHLRSGVGAATTPLQFVGVSKYEPGWAASHPVQNWGVPSYSKFTSISLGIVGYKFSQLVASATGPAVAQEDSDYLSFLQGDGTKITAIETFANWMTNLAGTTTMGSNLYLAFSRLTGFPRVLIGGPDVDAVTVPAGYVIAAQAVVFEPENEMVGFDFNGHLVYGA